jgi:NAD(P)-dependent dehydrogenase (short-subunit alcohol dehydrogenase family)
MLRSPCGTAPELKKGVSVTEAKLALVTGGASGIGEATARRFAQGGYRVVIADRNVERGMEVANEIVASSGSAAFEEVDLAEAATVDALAKTVLEFHGVPDVLVNSGGVLQNAVRILDMDMVEFDRVLQINLRGTVLVSRVFGSKMCQLGRGSIVQLCSLTTYRASAQVAYACSKTSLKMLTEIMAAEFGPKGVRVNAVAPGYTLTPAMQARMDSGERDPKMIVDRAALGRFVQSEEVAETIFFLCSPAASAITGITLPVDCGWLATTAYQSYAAQP